MAPYGAKYLKDFQKIGYGFWVEGQSPFGLGSFWYRKRKYAGQYEGNEFSLYETSPWTQGADGVLFLDTFKLMSYNCCPVVDARFFLNQDTPLAKRIAAHNHQFNRVLELVGPPRKVKQTDFGTLWIAEKGYALFAHEPRTVAVTGLNQPPDIQVLGRGGRILQRGRSPVVELWRENVAVLVVGR